VQPIVVKTWIADDDQVRWLMALLNGALRNRMGKVGIKKDAKGRSRRVRYIRAALLIRPKN
jgi:hypothetical protein